jgi:hypothetical protein
MLDRNRIYFLVKDPHWTFIWWGITQETMNKMKSVVREERMRTFTLRIHDITDICFDGRNSHHYFDIEAKGYTDHYYLEIWKSNRTYCAEIGFKGDGKVFYPIARSNSLHIPRDCPSDSHDEGWAGIDFLF